MAVELWLGQEFEHAHEMRALRSILNQMVDHFGESKELFLLLGNFYCDGADIDLAVVKKNAVIILELKECTEPVSGGPNSDWRLPEGVILNEGRLNPYQQARRYRYAVMNYLNLNRYEFLPKQKAGRMTFEHTSALVVFSPHMSSASTIEIPPRDKWFGVVGLDQLWTEIKDQRSPEIKLDQGAMRKMAGQVLGLTRYEAGQYLGLPEAEEVAPPVTSPPAKEIRPPEPLPERTAVVPSSSAPDLARLSSPIARDIIEALRSGTVPHMGLEYLAVGLDREMQTISGQLKYVATGRGGYKFVRGAYGAGKTFLSALTLEEALKLGFVTSYVVVSTDTPLYKLEAIYHRVVTNLATRGQQTGALKGLIDRWLYQLEEKVIELAGYDEDDPRLQARVEAEIESGLADIAHLHSAFSAVTRGYYQAQLEEDYPTAQALLGWLSGERQISAQVKRKVNIRGDIDNIVALQFLRAINSVARKAGFAGLAIVFDEVETIQRLRRPQREQSLNTLRQFVDSITAGDFPYTYMMFTGTPGFFEDRQGVPALKPLHDRIKLDHPDDPYPNPELPQLVLPKFNRTKLQAVAEKVLPIYEKAYQQPIDRTRITDLFLDFMIAEVTSKFGGRVDVVPRQFLRDLINVLDKARQYPDYNPDTEYEFDRAAVATELSPEEQEIIEPITF